MPKPRLHLIPRYNWDYGWRDLVRTLGPAFGLARGADSSFEAVFGQPALFTGSGRASLYAILKSLGLREGGGVAVPLYCCSVVFDAISQAGLVPVFVDIEPDRYTMSASDLRTRRGDICCVLAVHMFGHPADMDAIAEACGDSPVVEDCAQSLFSEYKGSHTGLLSTASFFSFRSGKYLSAGEGSAIFCADASLRTSLVELIKGFDDWGTVQQILHCASTYIKSSLYRRPWYGIVGHPVGGLLDRRLNLTAKSGFELRRIASTDLRIASDRVRSWRPKVERQRANALHLLDRLELPDASLPYERSDCWSNYSQFAIRFASTQQRDRVARHLFERGVDTAKYLDDIAQVARNHYGYSGGCPQAEACAKSVLVVPNHYTLSKRDLDHVVHSLNSAGRREAAHGI